MTSQAVTDTVCCPEFDPSLWNDKLIGWNDKRFIKDSAFTLFYMPVNFGSVMRRFDKVVTKSGTEMSADGLCLSDHTSKWNMDVYLAVDDAIPNVKNVTLSGEYYCKVYEGSFSDTGKWCEDFENVLKMKGLNQKKMFMWYTTCPKCAKKYGKNYVAIVAQVE